MKSISLDIMQMKKTGMQKKKKTNTGRAVEVDNQSRVIVQNGVAVCELYIVG